MNWWQQRLSIPTTRGYIRTQEKPDTSGTMKVSGGRTQAFFAAAAAISLFEQGVVALRHPQLHLRNIGLREGYGLLAKKIPLCPDPQRKQAKFPNRFRSLGMRVNKSLFYEYWFLVRIDTDELGFLWRLDYAHRTKKRGICLKWLIALVCWLSSIAYFVSWMSLTDLVIAFVLAGLGLMAFGLGNIEEGGESEYSSRANQIWFDALETVEVQGSSQFISSASAPQTGSSHTPSPVSPVSYSPVPNSTQGKGNRPRSRD